MLKSSKANGKSSSVQARPTPNAQSRGDSSALRSREESNAPHLHEELQVPTDLAALVDGPAYVRAVASQVDLVGASARLIVSADEKVAKAELDRLRELIFGKGGPPPADETLRIDWTGFPRPNREPPAFAEASGGERDDH